VSARPGAQNKVVAAAKNAFQCMTTWFKTHVER
jgi:hypothetical protein